MIIPSSELATIRQRHGGQVIVSAGGVFDLFHVGHLAALEWAKSQGDVLVVGIMGDDRVKRRKGEGRPVIPQQQRLAIVDAIKCVDYSYLVDFERGQLLTGTIKLLQPDIMIFSSKRDDIPGFKEKLLQHNPEMKFVSMPETMQDASTTGVIERIKNS